jgi:hypothetical protein
MDKLNGEKYDLTEKGWAMLASAIERWVLRALWEGTRKDPERLISADDISAVHLRNWALDGELLTRMNEDLASATRELVRAGKVLMVLHAGVEMYHVQEPGGRADNPPVLNWGKVIEMKPATKWLN